MALTLYFENFQTCRYVYSSTHVYPSQQLEVSGQFHDTSALISRNNTGTQWRWKRFSPI